MTNLDYIQTAIAVVGMLFGVRSLYKTHELRQWIKQNPARCDAQARYLVASRRRQEIFRVIKHSLLITAGLFSIFYRVDVYQLDDAMRIPYVMFTVGRDVILMLLTLFIALASILDSMDRETLEDI